MPPDVVGEVGVGRPRRSADFQSAVSPNSIRQATAGLQMQEFAPAGVLEIRDTAQRGKAPTKETKDGGKRFSLSPQRGEGRGEGWKRDKLWPRSEVFHRTTPRPHSLTPLRGEGEPRRRTRKNLRGLRRFG